MLKTLNAFEGPIGPWAPVAPPGPVAPAGPCGPAGPVPPFSADSAEDAMSASLMDSFLMSLEATVPFLMPAPVIKPAATSYESHYEGP